MDFYGRKSGMPLMSEIYWSKLIYFAGTILSKVNKIDNIIITHLIQSNELPIQTIFVRWCQPDPQISHQHIHRQKSLELFQIWKI